MTRKVKKEVESKSVRKRKAAQKAPVKKARTSIQYRTKAMLVSPETEGTFYKVFARDTYRGKSILVSPSIQGRLRTFYPEGDRTKANPELLEIGYGILIFDSLENAKRWRSSEIWKVQVGKVFECPAKRIHRNAHYRISERDEKGEAFTNAKVSWKTLASRLLRLADVNDSWPWGSKMVDWVIPVERVQ